LLDFLVMEFLDGMSLTDDAFQAIGERNQKIILQRLGEQLQLLRSIKLKGPTYYGRVDYQGWCRLTTFMRHLGPGFRGPFDTYEDFVSAHVETIRYLFATQCISPSPDFFPREIEHLADLKRILGSSKHREPVLTHFDLKWPNIIAWPVNPSADGGCDDWKVAIIDWDYAGWAPLYMQKASLLQRLYVPKDLLKQDMICGFHKDQYKEEVDLLMRHEDVWLL
jgi:hypothetical protein